MNRKVIEKILSSTPEMYDRISSGFYQTRKKPWPILDILKSHINNAKDIIDLGCGAGRLSKSVSKNQNYLGIDNSAKLIDIAKTTYSNRKNIKFQVSDIISGKLPENKFNLGLAIASIHHIPTKKLRQKTIDNISTTIRPGGKLIITSWNLWQKDYRRHLFNYKLKLIKYKMININDAFIPWKAEGKYELRYVHSLTKCELKKLLKKSGFEINSIFYEFKGKKSHILKGKNLIAIATKNLPR